ncbi:hypothetical protein R3W88_009047 [Solanum pinnatisectum]|uniref:Uncharacterized protein n=1 Tax=Solanum pinnatisectum TaxID=50273 RepID=A0AAV9M9R2_9SOLN|nr:hypothetical protein R3W88_009047 [Solanum pinnatisectum]
MLSSNCPKVFAVMPLDATVERPDEDDICTAYSEVQLFYEIPQTYMPNMQLTDFLADALVSAPYHHVVSKIHREGIAQAHFGVIAGQKLGKFREVKLHLKWLVFDPGGCTFDIPILEDMDGVLAEISKGITNLFWHFFMTNPFDGQNREMSNTIARAKRLKCDVKVRGLMITVKQWPPIHNVANTIYQKLFLLFAILRDILVIAVLANGVVTIKDNC